MKDIEEVNIEVKPFKCPNCNGFGTLQYGKKICHSCSGKGVIFVPQEVEVDPNKV